VTGEAVSATVEQLRCVIDDLVGQVREARKERDGAISVALRLKDEVAKLEGDRCTVCDEDGLIYYEVMEDDAANEEAQACPSCGGTRSGYASEVTRERDEARAERDAARMDHQCERIRSEDRGVSYQEAIRERDEAREHHARVVKERALANQRLHDVTADRDRLAGEVERLKTERDALHVRYDFPFRGVEATPPVDDHPQSNSAERDLSEEATRAFSAGHEAGWDYASDWYQCDDCSRRPPTADEYESSMARAVDTWRRNTGEKKT